MFNMLVSYGGWAEDSDSIGIGRCFEYTSDQLLAMFKPEGQIDLQKIRQIPTLLVSELGGGRSQQAKIVRITDARIANREILFEYSLDQNLPLIANSKLQELARELGIDSFEFSRSHWAIKDADLYRVLFKSHLASLPGPKVFRLDTVDGVDNNLVSVMMPFDRRFDGVHEALVHAVGVMDMQCLRADDIWEHDTVVQDVVSLISRSRVVICDCTGKNANVFYEAGIAHCLGKDVILIGQSESDIPFDLRHLRYVLYLDNVEGRHRLSEQVTARITTLRQR